MQTSSKPTPHNSHNAYVMEDVAYFNANPDKLFRYRKLDHRAGPRFIRDHAESCGKPAPATLPEADWLLISFIGESGTYKNGKPGKGPLYAALPDPGPKAFRAAAKDDQMLALVWLISQAEEGDEAVLDLLRRMVFKTSQIPWPEFTAFCNETGTTAFFAN